MKYATKRTITIIERNVGLSVFLFFAFLINYSGTCSAELTEAQYLYNLSGFTGDTPYTWSKLAIDEKRNEIYVIYKNEVDIFNDKGMKVYSFGDDEGLSGVIYDVAIAADGTMYLLLLQGDEYFVMHCNYRGEPISQVKFRNLPSDFSKFFPTSISYWSGELYLADLFGSKKVAVTDTNGLFKEGYDMNSLLGLDEYEASPGHEKEIGGFSVDREGNMLMTVPAIFRAFTVSRDRSVRSFGESGNIPGKFSVVAGISSDRDGNYYVVDKLKSVVMIFNADFRFIMEFGYRGSEPGNLIAPNNMVVHNDYVYVSQARQRGVSVFKIIQK